MCLTLCVQIKIFQFHIFTKTIENNDRAEPLFSPLLASINMREMESFNMFAISAKNIFELKLPIGIILLDFIVAIWTIRKHTRLNKTLLDLGFGLMSQYADGYW